MGKFDQAISNALKQAANRKAKAQTKSKAREAKLRAWIEAENAAAAKWFKEVVQPVVAEANDDLKDHKLEIRWSSEPYVGFSLNHPSPSWKLVCVRTDQPQDGPIGKSIRLIAKSGNVIADDADGGEQRIIATIPLPGFRTWLMYRPQSEQARVEKLILDRLREIGAGQWA